MNTNKKHQNLTISNAFTLIELLVIISIVGILALIGIPAFRAYQPVLQLNGSVRGLISDLRYTQQLTVTEQVEHSVYFITTERKYQIIRYGATTLTIKEVSLPTEIIEISITGLSDIDTNKEARYNPYGAVAESGSVTLKNSKNATTTINIKPSGFVKISD